MAFAALLLVGTAAFAPGALRPAPVAAVRSASIYMLEPVTTAAAAFAAGLVPPSLLLADKVCARTAGALAAPALCVGGARPWAADKHNKRRHRRAMARNVGAQADRRCHLARVKKSKEIVGRVIRHHVRRWRALKAQKKRCRP